VHKEKGPCSPCRPGAKSCGSSVVCLPFVIKQVDRLVLSGYTKRAALDKAEERCRTIICWFACLLHQFHHFGHGDETIMRASLLEQDSLLLSGQSIVCMSNIDQQLVHVVNCHSPIRSDVRTQ
jgi:hypothetical protein